MSAVAGDEQLLASGASQLLPDGTMIFSSTVRYPRAYYLVLSLAALLFIVLFLAGATADGSGKAGLISGAFVIL